MKLAGGCSGVGQLANSLEERLTMIEGSYSSWEKLRTSQGFPDFIAQFGRIFLTVSLASLLARGGTVFQPFYAIDTYSFAYTDGPSSLYSLTLSQGRYGLAALLWLRDAVGYFGIDVSVSALSFSIVLFSVGAILLAISVFQDCRPSTVLIFSGFIVLHPFGTEFFHFSEATFPISLAFLFGSAGTYLSLREPRNRLQQLAAIALIIIALSIYQSIVSCIAASIVLAAIVKLYLGEFRDFQSFARSVSLRAAGIMIASICFYLLSLILVKHVSGIGTDARTNFSMLFTIEGMKSKVRDLISAVGLFYWPQPGLISHVGSALLLVLLLASVMIIIIRMIRNGRPLAAVLTIFLIVGAVISSLFPQLAGSQPTWLVPRVLWPAVVPAAGVLALGWSAAPARWNAYLKPGLLLVALFYIGSSNHIINDQRRLNLFDMNQANRIVARLEGQSNFKDATTLVIIGGDWRRSTPLRTTVGDMNVSAFAVADAKLGLIQEATGYHFANPTPEQTSIAKGYCSASPVWPSEGSTKVIKDVGIACLTDAR